MTKIAYVFVAIVVFCMVFPVAAQEIGDMATFVSLGESGSLTNEQIEQYSQHWSTGDWWDFYYHLSIAKGFDNPRQWADKLIGDVNTGGFQQYYGHVIPRTHTYHSSMRQAHYWFTSTDACDENDTDTDYEFHFHVSASNVANMAWYSTDSWTARQLGGGGLKAYGDSSFTRICVGDVRICRVGGLSGCSYGADYVKSVLRLKP